jgi:hypothetical protein
MSVDILISFFQLLAMKVMLRSSSGKSLVLDVSPTDTFVDLQARTLRETGCLLDLQHFKYKGKEIKAENNVMKCFQDGMLIIYSVKTVLIVLGLDLVQY